MPDTQLESMEKLLAPSPELVPPNKRAIQE